MKRLRCYSCVCFIVLLFSTFTISCTKQDVPTNTSTPQEASGLRDSAESQNILNTEGVSLDNPNGEQIMSFKHGVMAMLIENSVNDGISLVLGERPSGNCYNSLLAAGVLPIIPANRYTGEDIKIIKEYSPGDIYLEYPTEDNLIYSFWMHMGDRDHFFDPEAVPEGQKLPLKGALMDMGETTDGKTYYRDIQVPLSMVVPIDIGTIRELHNIPADDDSRARIYLLYESIHEMLFQAGNEADREAIGETVSSLDDYIGLIGRKNPSAWMNPYTGKPMQEVPWTSVPTCYRREAPSEPGNHGKFIFDSGLTAEELAGNYSFTIAEGPGSESEMYSYVQFYFYMPDGSVAAYIGYGKTP